MVFARHVADYGWAAAIKVMMEWEKIKRERNGRRSYSY